MNQPKHAVRVTIGGEDYTVRSELPPDAQPIYSRLPTDDPEFAEIAADFVVAQRAKINELEVAVQNRDPVETLVIAHWIKGAGGTNGFPCFTNPAAQICEGIRDSNWLEIDCHTRAIREYTERMVCPDPCIGPSMRMLET